GDRFFAISGRSDNFDVRHRRQQRDEAFSDGGLIVGDDDSHTGTVARTVQPESCAAAVTSPPSSSMRSRMPRSPKPPPVAVSMLGELPSGRGPFSTTRTVAVGREVRRRGTDAPGGGLGGVVKG